MLSSAWQISARVPWAHVLMRWVESKLVGRVKKKWTTPTSVVSSNISCRRWTRATRCLTRIVLYAEVDSQLSVIYRVDKKLRPQTRGHNSVKSEPIFKIFVTGRFPGKFSVKCSLLKVPVHLAYCCHTFLWNRNVVKQAINDKLQGSVAKYLKCGGVVNNQSKKGLLLNLPVFFLNRWIFGKVTSKNVVVSCTFF